MKYPYKGAGVALLKKVNGEYEIMLGCRTIAPGAGKWSIPGGEYKKGVDKNSFDNAERELREETKLELLEIGKAKKPIIYSINWLMFRWETYMYEVDTDFEAPPKANLNFEFSEMKFIPLSELGNYKLACYVKSEIKHFLRNISKKVYR